MRTSIALALFALALAQEQEAVSGPTQIAKLHHRFVPSASGEVGAWTYRGDIRYDTGSSIADFEGSDSAKGEEYQGDSEGWYQLGIESDGEWIIGSTRAVRPSYKTLRQCYLAFPSTLTINLFLDERTPRGLTVHSSSAPISGECPKNSRSRSIELPRHGLQVKLQRPEQVYA